MDTKESFQRCVHVQRFLLDGMTEMKVLSVILQENLRDTSQDWPDGSRKERDKMEDMHQRSLSIHPILFRNS